MELVDIFKALGDENRIRIVNLLMNEELCVCEIETILDITQSNASRHLARLKSAGIISSHKEAQWVHYRVSDEFKSKSALLYQFVENAIQKNPQCLEDIKRLYRYKNIGFTCEQIRENKEQVVRYLGIQQNQGNNS